MKTNHRRGFVDVGRPARWITLVSKLSGRRAWCFEAAYDGHRGFARAKAGAKRRIRTGDRLAHKRACKETE
jgi:hypothetical protein